MDSLSADLNGSDGVRGVARWGGKEEGVAAPFFWGGLP